MPMIEPESASGEQPLFWLGLTGFLPDQRAAIESSLARSAVMPQWRLAPFREADAWFVNGAKCHVVPGGNLRIAPGLPNELAVNLDLSGVDRPVAFAEPLAPTDLEPRYRFDAASAAGIQGMLLHFDHWLGLARAQFVLGRHVVELGAKLRHGIFHVVRRDRLLAVLDFRRGMAAVTPQLHAGDLRDAEWSKRPEGAGALPSSFVYCSTAQLAWSYARRSERDLLPTRYREGTIYFRRAPRVPLQWLRDSQLLLLKELAAEGTTLAGLRQRTGLPDAQIERDISCLYYAAAITTTPSKAALRGAAADDSQSSTSLQTRAPATETGPAVPARSDPTVPAVLRV